MGNTAFGVGLPTDAEWAAAKDRQVGRRLMEDPPSPPPSPLAAVAEEDRESRIEGFR